MLPYSQDEERLARLLNGVSLGAALLSLVTLLAAVLRIAPEFLAEAPFVASTAAGFALLAVVARLAAADVRRFRRMIHLLVASFGFGTVASLALAARTAGSASVGAGQVLLLLALALVCGVLAVTLLLAQQSAGMADPPWVPWMPDKDVTSWERAGQIACAIAGVVSLAAAVAYLALALFGAPGTGDYFRQPLMIAGASLFLGTLGLCALFAVPDIRRYTDFMTLFGIGLGFSVVAALVVAPTLGRPGEPTLTLGGRTWTSGEVLRTIAIVDAVVLVVFGALRVLMNRALLDHLGFLDPSQFRSLEAISETVFEGGASDSVPPHKIALRTDDYLSSFNSRRVWVSRAALLGVDFLPLLWLRPPLSYTRPDRRKEFIDTTFKRDIVEQRGLYGVLPRIGLSRVVDTLEAAMRFCMQASYMGYYSDPTVQRELGYVPFSERTKDFPVKPIRRYPALNVVTPDELRHQAIDSISSADVVIIGSGAGGSILAEQLANQGRDVLLLEKGRYVKPDDFSENEIDMISRLYSDGAVQVTQSFRFTIIQGSCVGGSTVVNNAVCFDPPRHVLEAWNDPAGTNAGIDIAQLEQAQAAVRERLNIRSVKLSSATRPWEQVLNPGDHVVEAGAKAYLNGNGYHYDVVEANIADCLGCGYCNIGCKYGRKLSMLDEVLPRAQATHPDRFRIISEAEVVKLEGDGSKVTSIHATIRGRRELIIRNPKTVIVSAGTVASSWLLMRSGIGKGQLPVGRNISFNMGSPLHGYFEERLNSYAGLQIAHFLKLDDHPGFVYETWYNPPVAQALAMPGWLDTHQRNMNHFAHLTAVGVLVGTEPTAYLTNALFFPGAPDVVYKPTQRDLNTLVEALIMLGKILFAGGAKEVFAGTRHYRDYTRPDAVYRSENDLENLRTLIKDDTDILLGTGHPQGGNAMSKDRGRDGKRGGVVSPDFQVYGHDNLYVCDASVFPSSLTVNPQLTVMSMAHYAADRIR